MDTNRKTVIAGNWKMNMTPKESAGFVTELKTLLKDKDHCEIVVCVPDVDIASVSAALSGSNIKLGAQNAHWALKGAFTGETSVNMLKEYGVGYVIIGHSERRQFFGEINDSVNKRLKTILAAGLKAIVCVGELLKEKELGITTEVVSLQTKVALHEITPEQMQNVIIAYEPVWAIGTGKNATADDADSVNGFIRGILANLYSEQIAQSATIQYGGSMNAENAAALLSKPNVDGGLIGGASLNAKDFAAIVDAAKP
ncbi:MAG: triose-phosphate isomerase [Oscillospiraceae bacterium]|nr:triose-phosphate isomerase [Oscillospiraceae bacterium]